MLHFHGLKSTIFQHLVQKMVGAELVPFAQTNSNFFRAYCYFQIAVTHGLGEFHLR